jgi:hypothetical protein
MERPAQPTQLQEELNDDIVKGNEDSIDNFVWSESGQSRKWAKSRLCQKEIKNISVLSSSRHRCNLSTKNHNTADNKGVDNDIAKNSQAIVQNISSQMEKNKKVLDKFFQGRRGLAIATGVGIVGVVSTAAIGFFLLAAGGTVAAGSTVFAASAVSDVAIGGLVTASGMAVGGTLGVLVTKIISSKNGKSRLIIFGSKTTDCKVGLIRANISIDEEWDDIITELKEQSPFRKKSVEVFKIRFGKRTVRDADIRCVDDDELSKEEKIFLLVSRTFNDNRSSLSYVYKRLIAKIKERASDRESHTDGTYGERPVRQDVHAVIKHLTTLLLIDRPEMNSSPETKESATSCVESLILSQSYDSIYQEIIHETDDDDSNLQNMISKYHSQNLPTASTKSSSAMNDDPNINSDAIAALQSLPAHRTASGKLDCCVTIFQALSECDRVQSNGADWLLGTVCKHIIYANVPNLNGEILFLEEFVNDKQLLRGIEGYSLITLLASLRFLNTAPDLDEISLSFLNTADVDEIVF